jgi:hypothetical protein
MSTNDGAAMATQIMIVVRFERIVLAIDRRFAELDSIRLGECAVA